MAFPSSPVNISAQTVKGPYESTYAADSLDLTETAADATEGNQFTGSGHEILLMHNTHATNPYTVTILSVALPTTYRSGDIEDYTIGATQIAAFCFAKAIAIQGWSAGGVATGKVKFQAENAAVKFIVLGNLTQS